MEINLLAVAVSFAFTFIATLLLVPVVIKGANRFNLLDHPDEHSVHKVSRPLCGGFAVALPILAVMLFRHLFMANTVAFPNFLVFIAGSCGILIAGFFDDKYHLSAGWKLMMQIVLAIFMFWGGFRITLLTNPWNDAISLGIISFPVTIGWFLLLINSFNLIDGLDGLATGIAVIVSAILIIIGYRFSNPYLFNLSLLLFAANLAFIFFNFPPAKIFLGDTGSQFIGFFIAAVTIAGTAQYKGIAAMTLLIPILLMFIPLSDTLLAILRRLKHRKGIFTRDQHHLHHKMLKRGLTPRTINYICYFITFLFGLIALGFSFADKNLLFTILICLAIIVFVVIYFIAKKELLK
jgi:UDP-GlcNAc:undecaprenyl-phosphate GlcNAc-1-phosphate transferase